jgi:biotin carboxyl carrier protein
MEYKIQDIEGTFNGKIVQSLGNNEYVIKINDTEHPLTIISMNARGIEFILDQKYHNAKYIESTTAHMNIIVDGTPMTLNMHSNFDKIVYKNSGGGGSADLQLALHSQIPGKVVSIAVQEGSTVKKGDTICTLESMKMQVGVKSHKSGTVISIKVKEGASVAKNDLIAEIK